MALGRLSKCCRSFLHEPSKGVLCGFLHSDWRKSCLQAKRHLLTEDIIKLQEFQRQKLVAAQLPGEDGCFIQRVNEKLQKKHLILRHELKHLLHLCQTPDDMIVARDAIYRYHSENPHTVSTEFKFGPLFMRLCYELGLEEMAAATITDTTLKGFFSDATSFNIAIDMLFLKGAYDNALEVLRTMQMYNIPLNKPTLILASGTCYKLNTPESYRICTSFIGESPVKWLTLPRPAYYFATALALRQNDIEMAESLLSNIFKTEGRLYGNLKVLTLAKSGKFEEVASVLLDAALHKAPAFIKKQQFSQEVVEFVRLQCEDEPCKTEINQILSQLEQAGQVIQMTLDDLLCYTPVRKPKSTLIMEHTRTKSRRTLQPLHFDLYSE